MCKQHQDSATIWNNLGNQYVHAGQIQQAKACFHKAIALQPGLAASYQNLCNCSTILPDDPLIQDIQHQLEQPNCSDENKLYFEFTLGSIYLKQKQHKLAFQHFLAGNNLQQDNLQKSFNWQQHQFNLDHLLGCMPNAEKIPCEAPSSSPQPIFIVGMPRSGTTLAEQILARHPKITGAGELSWIRDIALDIMRVHQTPQQALQNLTKAEINHFAEQYRQGLTQIDDQAIYIVDKMPHNFEQLWLINLLFNKPKIIHCTRNAIDNCLSCFFTLFTESHFYSNDLPTLGRYHKSYQQLMTHWQQTLPCDIHTLPYEDIVAQPEQTIRALLQYCELDWDEKCLSFHKNRQPVQTASKIQVRQPLYSSSVNRWQPFEQQLQPLISALKDG